MEITYHQEKEVFEVSIVTHSQEELMTQFLAAGLRQLGLENLVVKTDRRETSLTERQFTDIIVDFPGSLKGHLTHLDYPFSAPWTIEVDTDLHQARSQMSRYASALWKSEKGEIPFRSTGNMVYPFPDGGEGYKELRNDLVKKKRGNLRFIDTAFLMDYKPLKQEIELATNKDRCKYKIRRKKPEKEYNELPMHHTQRFSWKIDLNKISEEFHPQIRAFDLTFEKYLEALTGPGIKTPPGDMPGRNHRDLYEIIYSLQETGYQITSWRELVEKGKDVFKRLGFVGIEEGWWERYEINGQPEKVKTRLLASPQRARNSSYQILGFSSN